MVFDALRPRLTNEQALERAKTYKSSVAPSVSIPITDRRGGTYVCGQQGMGKTTLLSRLILQDIRNGFGVFFIDVHDTTKEIIKRTPASRLKDVILLDEKDWKEHPFGLNIFECENPRDNWEVHLALEFTMHLFERIFNVTPDRPMVSDYLRAVTLLALKNPGTTLADISRFFRIDAYRQWLLSNLGREDEEVKAVWEDYDELKDSDKLNHASYILNKVRAFTVSPFASPIFGQAKSTINMRSVIEERKIFILKMHESQLLDMIATVLVARILKAALSREDLPEHKRVPFFLYLDEFQNLEGIEDVSTLFAEARKYNVCTLVAHQYRDQLSSKNRAAMLNVTNKIFFRLSGRDADELAKELDRTPIAVPGDKRLEPIKTPVSDVIGHVLGGKSHSETLVTEFLKSFANIYQVARQNLREDVAGATTTKTTHRHTRSSDTNTTITTSRPPREGNKDDVERAREIIDFVNATLYEVMRTGDPHAMPTIRPRFDIEKDFNTGDVEAFEASLTDSERGIWTTNPPSLVRPRNDEKGLAVAGKPAGYEDYISVDELRIRLAKWAQSHPNPRLAALQAVFKQVKEILARFPILITSGEYEEVATERLLSYADTEKSIANTLAMLPKFSALAMLDGKQVAFAITPLSPGRSEDALLRAFSFVQANTRKHYTRPYQEVMQDVARRQGVAVIETDSLSLPDMSELLHVEKRYARRSPVSGNNNGRKH